MPSNFITAPDYLPFSISHSIVIVDAVIADIDPVALICKASEVDFDIYLYKSTENDAEWLTKVAKNADKIFVYPYPATELKTAICQSSKTVIVDNKSMTPANYIIQRSHSEQ